MHERGYILIEAELEALRYNLFILSSYQKPVKNIQLTCWLGGEESLHQCPCHLDHSESQSPDISLHPDDHTCSQGYEGRRRVTIS